MSPQLALYWDLAAAIGLGVVGVWVLIGVRLWRGERILPYQPRRSVPWRGVDVLLVLLAYLVFAFAAQSAVVAVLGQEISKPAAGAALDQADTEHIIARLLRQEHGWVLVLCGLSAVVVAPIVEEFFFRVILQGWLEAEVRRRRRRMPTLRRLLPRAVGPIVLSSFLFGWLHFRVAAPAQRPEYYVGVMVGNAVASLLTMAAGIALLHLRAGATALDLGWSRPHFRADLGLGLLAALAVVVPSYLLQWVLSLLLPKYLAPDPFTLFLFALVLGTLYQRTHRILPSVIVHMSLNATSTALLLLWR